MKKTRINRIIEEKVINILFDDLNNLGYSYSKSKKTFSKKESELLHKISIYKDFQIFTDEKLDRVYDLYLVFTMYFKSEFYKFEEWYYDNFGADETRINTYYESSKFCVPLISGKDFLIPDDFHPNQNTFIGEGRHLIKDLSNGIYQFQNFSTTIEINDFESHKTKILKCANEQLKKKYNYEQMALDNNIRFKYQALLIYKEMFKIPKQYLKGRFEYLNSEIKNTIDENKKRKLIEALEHFKMIEKKYLN